MNAPSGLDPKVTILMPVHNGENYLGTAIASVIEQDFRSFEFVIVDDASTDATPDILRRWAERDSRIVVVRTPERGGVARSLNIGLEHARGTYVGRQDADDICLPGRLARQVALLDAEQDVVLVGANYDLIDHDGEIIGRMRLDHPSSVIRHLLHFGNAVGGHGQVMFRRRAAVESGAYRERYELSEDYDLWARLSFLGRIVILPEIGMRHRLHDRRYSILHAQHQRASWTAVSSRMLKRLLGRELSPAEASAVQSVWSADGQDGVATNADRILRAAYALCGTTKPADRRRIRLVTATHWLNSAVALARRGMLLEAIRHLGRAMLWHPGGVGVGAVGVMRQIYMRMRRPLRTGRKRPAPPLRAA